MENNNIIQLQNVTKLYGDKKAVNNISLNIRKGEFVTLLGPSGCGKTTTLRMIAGFETPTEGRILFNGEDITSLPPHKRTVNTVFQKYALFPHLNVFNNIAFGLKLKYVPDGTYVDKKGVEYEKQRKLTKREIEEKVNAALKMVDLEDYGHRNVNSLSGGQQQRVAIARALVNEPEVLLLAEPLGALDLKMRKDMQIELMNMHRQLGITFIYVTHDQEEALTMSDTIVVMKDGVVQQIGKPQAVYDSPVNLFVAKFLGTPPINVFDGEVKDAAGEAAHHFLIFIGLLQGGHHGAAFDIAAVDEKVLKTPAAPATRWQGGETRHAHSLARTLDRRETQGQIPAQHGVDGAFQLAIPGSEQLLFAVPDELHGQLRVGQG